MSIAALAAIALTLVGCDGAPSTPLPEGTVAVVAGHPITHAEFLATREEVGQNVQWMKQNSEPDSEWSRMSGGALRDEFLQQIEAIERYGFDTVALAGLIADYALRAAVVAAGYEVSDEEVAEHIAERRALLLSAIKSEKQEGESTQEGVQFIGSQSLQSDYATIVAEAGGEEALWEEAANQAKRDLPRTRFLAAEFDRISREEYVSYREVRIGIEQAAVVAAKIVMTDDPAIATTLEDALAYLEWVWDWETERLEQQQERYAAPSR